MVDWPETRSDSGPVVVACPGNEGRTVTRECIDGIWTEADYDMCLSLGGIQTMVSFHSQGTIIHTGCHAPHHNIFSYLHI